MVFQVKYGIQNGPEDRLPQLPNQRPVLQDRNQQHFRNEEVNEQVCTDQRLPEYFHHEDNTSIARSGPDGNSRNDISQRAVSTAHERTVSPALKRTILLEDTGKELRRVADMYIVTRNTGHELRRIADEIWKRSFSERNPSNHIFIEEVCDALRRKNS